MAIVAAAIAKIEFLAPRHEPAFLQDHEKGLAIQFGHARDRRQLTAGNHRSDHRVTVIGEHDAAWRDTGDRTRIAVHRSRQQRFAIVLDQVEAPVRVHPVVANIGQAAGRLEMGEIDARARIVGAAFDDRLEGGAQVAAEPRVDPNAVITVIVARE